MDFLNKAKSSLADAGAKIGQKASSVSESASLSMKIHKEEKDVEAKIAELGKAILEQHTDVAKQYCPEIVAAIDGLKAQIEADKKSLATSKGLKICPGCGAEQDIYNAHCTVCGKELEIPEPPKAMQKRFCTNCGNELGDGVMFCPNCGTKQEAAAAAPSESEAPQA